MERKKALEVVHGFFPYHRAPNWLTIPVTEDEAILFTVNEVKEAYGKLRCKQTQGQMECQWRY